MVMGDSYAARAHALALSATELEAQRIERRNRVSSSGNSKLAASNLDRLSAVDARCDRGGRVER